MHQLDTDILFSLQVPQSQCASQQRPLHHSDYGTLGTQQQHVALSKNSSMSDKPKIHVFMGAPPPPPLVSVPGGGVEDEEDSLGQWRTMELSWQAGRLRPRTGEDGRERRGFLHTSRVCSSQELGKNSSPTVVENCFTVSLFFLSQVSYSQTYFY